MKCHDDTEPKLISWISKALTVMSDIKIKLWSSNTENTLFLLFVSFKFCSYQLYQSMTTNVKSLFVSVQVQCTQCKKVHRFPRS